MPVSLPVGRAYMIEPVRADELNAKCGGILFGSSGWLYLNLELGLVRLRSRLPFSGSRM